MGALADIYAANPGSAIRGGPADLGLLGKTIAAMPGGSWGEHLGTNINQMTALDPSEFYYNAAAPSSNYIGVWESTPNHQIQDWNGKSWYSPKTGRIGVVGTTNGAVGHPEASKAIYFDPWTNTWSWQRNPTGLSEGHLYDGNVSRPAVNDLVFRRAYNSNTISAANHTETLPAWSAWTSVTNLSLSNSASLEVFPDLGAQGTLLIADDNTKLWTVDIATKALTPRSNLTGGLQYPVSCYLSGPKCVVFGGGGGGSVSASYNTRLYRLDVNNVVTEITHTPPAGLRLDASAFGGSCVPSPDGNSLLVFSQPLGQLWRLTLSGSTGTWSLVSSFPPVLSGDVQLIRRTLACTLHGQGAVALFYYQGSVDQNAPLTRSKFLLWKE